MIRSLIAGSVTAGLLVTGAVYAQGPRPGAPGRGGTPGIGRGMAGLPLGSLNLTQAQRDLVRDIRERHREDARQFESRLRAAQEAQRAAVTAIPMDEAPIRATTLALAEVQAELAIRQARVQNEIFAVLTPEQQEQVRNARAERAARATERAERVQQRREQRNR